MKARSNSCSLLLSLIVLAAAVTHADVKTRNKTQVTLEGMLGTVAGMFGGRTAREGTITSSAVKGDRKITMNESTGRIVDLAEEKVYELDLKKKTYKVVTFAELRQQLKDAQERAQREADKAAKEQSGKDKEKEKEKPSEKQSADVEVDFALKETGQKKQIAGYDAREVVMTITVREKGKTLEQSGGLVITSDQWLGPEVPAMKELADFEMRYWKAVAPETVAISAQQMAMLIAQYPKLREGMERLNREKVNLKGTPLSNVTTIDAAKSAEQVAADKDKPKGTDTSPGGMLGGMLARRMAKKDEPKRPVPENRATIVTISDDTLEIATAVSAADLEIPAGFKQDK